MKSFSICFATILLLPLVAFAAQKNEIIYFTGTISKYPVEMTLNFDSTGKNVTGFYHYGKKAAWLNLIGTCENGTDYRINESPVNSKADDQQRTSGTFYGKFITADIFTGQWKSSDGKTVLDFNLKKDCSENGVCFKKGKFQFDSTIGEHSASATMDYLMMNGPVSAVNWKIDTFNYDRLYYKEMFNMNEADVSIRPHYPDYRVIPYEYVHQNANNDFTVELDVETSVVWNGCGILCVDNYMWEYSGGAHGNGYAAYNCFNLKTGDHISESDIFLKGFEEPLRLKAIEHLDHESEELFMPKEQLELNHNFFLTPEGIGYFYNSYEIACYMCGTPMSVIPWSEINEWIDPQGPMGWVKK